MNDPDSVFNFHEYLKLPCTIYNRGYEFHIPGPVIIIQTMKHQHVRPAKLLPLLGVRVWELQPLELLVLSSFCSWWRGKGME